ncbi:MAG: flagellar biosynthetic protein FliP, partial [Hyphomonadaceae bacterium]|nr:flagellar biosynthetic protein FliP [Clostridia bacterium]
MTNRNKTYHTLKLLLFSALFLGLIALKAHAEPIAIPNIGINVNPAQNTAEAANSLNVLFMLTILSLAPSILIMMTAFTRIIIVLSFVRTAIGIQQMPPNQILVGLALFLTFFVMA